MAMIPMTVIPMTVIPMTVNPGDWPSPALGKPLENAQFRYTDARPRPNSQAAFEKSVQAFNCPRFDWLAAVTAANEPLISRQQSGRLLYSKFFFRAPDCRAEQAFRRPATFVPLVAAVAVAYGRTSWIAGPPGDVLAWRIRRSLG